MNANNYWQMFLETGAPEMYLLYNEARKTEANHVFDNTSAGIACNGLQ